MKEFLLLDTKLDFIFSKCNNLNLDSSLTIVLPPRYEAKKEIRYRP